ncbi:MAG TPA: hypothetical protein VNO33_22990 [Kofleriaceae bacterium]|nr:hypothetical protein [Kofleriaceae bacterium]
MMMTQMVPRLWEYQVEFPARTVAHIMLGFTIGVLLVLKVSILRWFRHFEEWMPAIGVSLLVCTVLLSGLSLPFVVREQAIAASDETFSPENRKRVRQLLASAGFPKETDLDRLAGENELRHGRQVLLDDCTFCHDLRTAISRPRTPGDWVRTVERMVEKPTIGPRIRPVDAHAVAAYLIAITPELQRSAKAKRHGEIEKEEALQAASEIGEEETGSEAGSGTGTGTGTDSDTDSEAGSGAEVSPVTGEAIEPEVAAKPRPRRSPSDPQAASKAYEEICSKCHGLGDIDAAPPRSTAQVRSLMKRMIENGMEASRKDLELIRYHLIKTFVEAK